MLLLAFRSLSRQRLRTAIALAAIVFGVAGVILSGGFVRDMFFQLGEALIHSQSGHLQVATNGYFTYGSRSPERYRFEVETANELIRTQQVKSVMARLHFSGLLGNGRSDWAIVGEGVEPDKEARLGTHLLTIAGRPLNDNDGFAIALGQGVAQVLALSPGDRVSLLVNTDEGALNTLDFEVAGVFQTFSRDYDARAVRIPLRAAQELLAARGANVIVVELQDTQQTSAVAASLVPRLSANKLELKTWKELNDFYDKTVTLYERQFGVLQVIVLAMVLLGVANAVNMNIFERIGEFGTMMALGRRSSFVFRLVVLESVLLGVMGSALGVLVGVLIALTVSAAGIPMPPPPNANVGYNAHIQIVPEILALAALLGCAAALAASVIPGLRVSRLPIAEALRRLV